MNHSSKHIPTSISPIQANVLKRLAHLPDAEVPIKRMQLEFRTLLALAEAQHTSKHELEM